MKAYFTCIFFLVLLTFTSQGQTDISQDKYVSATIGVGDHEYLYLTKPTHFDPSLKKDSLQIVSAIYEEFKFLDPRHLFQQKMSDLKNILAFKPSDFIEPLDPNAKLLSKLNEKIDFGGEFEIETFVSNQNLPYSLNERTYTRFRATPNLSILGLPFSSDIYLTTEDNSYFNSNSFTLKFDLDKYKESLTESLEEAYQKKKKELYQLSDFDQDLDNYKSDVDRKIKELENRAAAEKDKQKQALQQKLEEEQDALKERAADSLSSYKAAAKDTLGKTMSSINDAKEKSDSIQEEAVRKIQEINEKVAFLKSYIEKADSLKKAVGNSKEIVEVVLSGQKESLVKKASNEKGKFINKTKDSILHSKPIQQFIAGIEDFQIGMTNPYFSENSLNGIPVKGLNIKRISASRSIYYRVSAGNSVASFNPFERASRRENLYSRRVVATKTGFGEEGFNDLYFVSMTVWDPLKSDSSNQVNTVNGLGYNFVLDKINFKSELTHSYFQDKSEGLQVSTEGNANSTLTSVMGNIAIFGELNYKITKKNRLKIKYDQKNQNFRSLGSPFLRNNYRLLDLNSSNYLLKNKVVLSGFYKFFEDNVAGLSDNTNKMKGFGATLQTNFKKYPNVLISYTPFEQSNNHQDSLLRTNNKFQSLSSQLNYSKSIDNHFFQTFVSHNLAIVEYEESGFTPANTSILSFNQVYQNDKLNANIGYAQSRTMPSIDSLSFNSLNCTISYRLKFGTIGSTILTKHTLASGDQSSQSVYLDTKFGQRFNFKITAGHRYIDGIWGLRDTHIMYGQLILRCRI